MKNVLFVSVVLLTLASCSLSGLKVHRSNADDQRTHYRPELTGFNRIEQLGSMDVKYAQADTFSVLVLAPSEVLRYVETRVDGEKLIINMKDGDKLINFGVADSDGVTVYVTSPDFLGIELKGSGDFDCQGLLDTDNLDIVLKGSGDVEFDNIICDQVNVSLVGSGDVEVKTVKTLRSRVSLVGSGDVKMRFDDSGSVESNLTGSGDITLKGSVREFKSNVRGSGEINTEKLTVK